MTSPTSFVFRACLVSRLALFMTAASLPLHAEKRPGRDRLAAALEYLTEAKKSKAPILLLHNAKDEVEGTLMPHQQVQRDNAIKAINVAIDGALRDEPKEQERIERAIQAVRALSGQKAKK